MRFWFYSCTGAPRQHECGTGRAMSIEAMSTDHTTRIELEIRVAMSIEYIEYRGYELVEQN